LPGIEPSGGQFEVEPNLRDWCEFVTKRTRFIEQVSSPQILVAPGAHDAMTAKVIAEINFGALYITGAGLANCGYGQPDTGVISYTEVLQAARSIIDATALPAIVDADTGYGGPVNIRRTVRDFDEAGAAALHIEDQVFPKRCGYLEGSKLVSKEEMCQRIRVAVDSRRDPDFLIIARTERRLAGSFEESVARAKSYQAAGADMTFVNGIVDETEARRVPNEVPGPQLYNYSGSDDSPLLTAAEAEELGYSVLIYTIHALRLALQATFEMYREVRETGDMKPWLSRMISFQQWQDLTGVPEFYEFESQYNK
jgi:2-methylisocitrate lyase-like PEP mutase family enzyme